MKFCTKCKHEKPESDFGKRGRHSLRSWCRDCDSAECRRWGATARGKEISRRSNQLPQNREARRRYEKTEKCNAYRVAYRNSDRGRAARRERVRRYSTTAKGKVAKAIGNACRKAKTRADVGHLTVSDWRAILVNAKGHCHYCQCEVAQLTMDHVVPLSRGGFHSRSNVVAACADCNSRKGAIPADDFRTRIS